MIKTTDEKRFYAEMLPVADREYACWLDSLNDEE